MTQTQADGHTDWCERNCDPAPGGGNACVAHDRARTVPLPRGFFGRDAGAENEQVRYERNERRAALQGLAPCETCGRGVAPGKGFVVVVGGGGSYALHPDDAAAEERDPGYMGAYVVGSTCATRVPAEFRTPWEG